MTNPFDEILQKLNYITKRLETFEQATENAIEIIDRIELCKRLGITEPTAIKYGKTNKIPEIRIGSCVKYNWPAVISTLENSNVSPSKKDYGKRYAENLTDNYIKNKLVKTGFNRSDINSEIINTKRIQLEIKREIKNIENEK